MFRGVFRKIIFGIVIVLVLALAGFLGICYYYGGFRSPVPPHVVKSTSTAPVLFNFTVTSDIQRHMTFPILLEKMKEILGGGGAFQVSPGDITPLAREYKYLRDAFGEDFMWYPCQGNHDHHEAEDIEFSHSYFDRKLADHVNPGPAGCEKTTYSWDFKNAHFIVLNLYFDGKDEYGTDGDVVDELYEWLEADLEKNRKPAVFVFGHEPAFPFYRQRWSSLNRYKAHRDRFWKLLEDSGVAAYFCGHTHKPAVYRENEGKTWQVQCGEARGRKNHKEDAFVNVIVRKDEVEFQLFTNENLDGNYVILHNWIHPVSQKSK